MSTGRQGVHFGCQAGRMSPLDGQQEAVADSLSRGAMLKITYWGMVWKVNKVGVGTAGGRQATGKVGAERGPRGGWVD